MLLVKCKADATLNNPSLRAVETFFKKKKKTFSSLVVQQVKDLALSLQVQSLAPELLHAAGTTKKKKKKNKLYS